MHHQPELSIIDESIGVTIFTLHYLLHIFVCTFGTGYQELVYEQANYQITLQATFPRVHRMQYTVRTVTLYHQSSCARLLYIKLSAASHWIEGTSFLCFWFFPNNHQKLLQELELYDAPSQDLII